MKNIRLIATEQGTHTLLKTLTGLLRFLTGSIVRERRKPYELRKSWGGICGSSKCDRFRINKRSALKHLRLYVLNFHAEGGEALATTRVFALHIGTGRSVSTAIGEIIDYVENPNKTDNGRLISDYGCNWRIADNHFLLSKREYHHITGRDQGRRDVLAYHIRQAFKPGEVSPEEANEIGRQLAFSFTKSNHAFIVCTHIDKHCALPAIVDTETLQKTE